jgi:hypothetical protein
MTGCDKNEKDVARSVDVRVSVMPDKSSVFLVASAVPVGAVLWRLAWCVER